MVGQAPRVVLSAVPTLRSRCRALLFSIRWTRVHRFVRQVRRPEAVVFAFRREAGHMIDRGNVRAVTLDLEVVKRLKLRGKVVPPLHVGGSSTSSGYLASSKRRRSYP